MNWDQFKKNVGWRFELEPVACSIDAEGNELPIRSDIWLLSEISPDGVVRLSNTSTGHVAELAKDHIYDFRSNPGRSKDGVKHGFLVLKMQVFMSGARLWLRPNSRPGERVSPHHRPPSQPKASETILRLLPEIGTAGWSGTPTEFNALAAEKLYGKELALYLPEFPDYFSALIVNGFIMIAAVTDRGNHPDGSPDTTVLLALTEQGEKALRQWQSN